MVRDNEIKYNKKSIKEKQINKKELIKNVNIIIIIYFEAHIVRWYLSLLNRFVWFKIMIIESLQMQNGLQSKEPPWFKLSVCLAMRPRPVRTPVGRRIRTRLRRWIVRSLRWSRERRVERPRRRLLLLGSKVMGFRQRWQRALRSLMLARPPWVPRRSSLSGEMEGRAEKRGLVLQLQWTLTV